MNPDDRDDFLESLRRPWLRALWLLNILCAVAAGVLSGTALFYLVAWFVGCMLEGVN